MSAFSDKGVIMAVGYALIISGIVFLGLCFVVWYYGRIFSGELEEYEARITAIKPMTSRPYNMLVCPEAEYSIDGELVRGHYYTQVLERAVNAKVGDTVRVQVNPKHPKVFRIEDIESTMSMKNTKKNTPVLAAVGVLLVIAGVIVLIISKK
jgi:hypothetical protein